MDHLALLPAVQRHLLLGIVGWRRPNMEADER